MMILRRGSEASLQLSEGTLRIDWSAPQPRIFRDDDKNPLAMNSHGVFYVYRHKNLSVFSGRQEADVFPRDLWHDGPGVYLPFQGWWQDRWYDGPLLHFTRQGPTDIVLAGRPGQLTLDEAPGDPIASWDEWQLNEAFASWKDSLLTAYRQRFPLQKSYVLAAPSWDRRTVLHLSLQRLAFPEARIFLHAKKEDASPAWRRLCQNLNIEIPRHFAEEKALFPPMTGSERFLQSFLIALQKQAPFVPGHLARDLAISPTR